MTTLQKPERQKQQKKTPGILFLGRFQCSLYIPETNQMYPLVYPVEIVRDLEVVKKEDLVTLIKDLVTKSQISPRPISVLLSDEIIFAKSITVLDIKGREDAVNAFIDTIPFEEPSVIKVPSEPHLIVAVANRDYFMSFKKAFENNGFSFELVLPAFLLKKYGNLSKIQDQSTFSAVFKHLSEYRQYNLNQEETIINSVKPLISKEVPKDKKRLYALGGLFGVLIIILSAVVYFSLIAPTSEVVPPPSSPQQPVTTAPVIVEEVQLSAVIVFTPLAASAAAELRIAIEEYGIESVELQQETDLVASRSGIFFSPRVDQAKRQQLVELLQKIGTDLTAQEDPDAQTDIVIRTIN